MVLLVGSLTDGLADFGSVAAGRSISSSATAVSWASECPFVFLGLVEEGVAVAKGSREVSSTLLLFFLIPRFVTRVPLVAE